MGCFPELSRRSAQLHVRAAWIGERHHSTQFFLFGAAPAPDSHDMGTACGLVCGHRREMVKSQGFEVRHTQIRISGLPRSCCATEVSARFSHL